LHHLTLNEEQKEHKNKSGELGVLIMTWILIYFVALGNLFTASSLSVMSLVCFTIPSSS
ncbi:hypothetical protein KIL84_017447, partial [Mauremys mutica]